MSFFDNGFDAEQVEPSKGFDPIPNGDYTVIISSAEEKQTKSGNGSFIALEFTLIEGEFKDRKLFANLNVDNPNSKAVDIALAELSAICRAIGVVRPRSPEEMCNIPLIVKVAQKKREDTGEMQNYIKKFSSTGDGATETNSVRAARAAATTSSTPATPPWQRK